MQIIVYILFFACELQIDKETQILMGIQVCLRTSAKKISVIVIYLLLSSMLNFESLQPLWWLSLKLYVNKHLAGAFRYCI